MKFMKIIIEDLEPIEDKKDRLDEIQKIARKYDVQILRYDEETGNFNVIGKGGDLNKFFEELQKANLVELEEAIGETWEEVYKKFQLIIDEFFPNEDEINSRVYDLYMKHQGEPAWETAYDKWQETDKEDLEEALEIDPDADTSWIDDLLDVLRTYPKVKDDSFMMDLYQTYTKHFPHPEAIEEELEFSTLTKIVSGIDGSHLEIVKDNIIPNIRSFRAEYIDGDSIGNTFDFIYAGSESDELIKSMGKDPLDLPTEILEIDGKDEGAFYIFDVDEWIQPSSGEILKNTETLNEATINPEIGIDGSTLYSDYDDILKGFLNKKFPNLFTSQELNEIITNQAGKSSKFENVLLSLMHEIIGDGGYLGGYRYWTNPANLAHTGLQNYPHLMPKLKQVIRSLFVSKSSKRKVNHIVDFARVDQIDECPYLIGSSDEKINIADRFDLSEDELWATGWIGAVQNVNEGPFDSFDQLNIYCYDQEKNKEYPLPEISSDIKVKFVNEVNKYIRHTAKKESLKEDLTPEELSEKADDIQFVIEQYFHNQPPHRYEFECVSADGFTWEVCDYDKCVTLKFDPNWSEWVYTINGKGPYSHSSYEFLNKDLEAVFRDIPDPEDNSESLPEALTKTKPSASKPANHWTNHPVWKTLINEYDCTPDELLKLDWLEIPAESKEMMSYLIDSGDLDHYLDGGSRWMFRRAIESASYIIDASHEDEEGDGDYEHRPELYNFDPHDKYSQKWDYTDMPETPDEEDDDEYGESYTPISDELDDEEINIDYLYRDASEDELRKMGAFDNLNDLESDEL